MNRGNQTNLKVTDGSADRPDSATSKDERMPWVVRIALGWFVLLAIASCAPLVYVQTLWKEGWGWECVRCKRILYIPVQADGLHFLSSRPMLRARGLFTFSTIPGSRISSI